MPLYLESQARNKNNESAPKWKANFENYFTLKMLFHKPLYVDNVTAAIKQFDEA